MIQAKSNSEEMSLVLSSSPSIHYIVQSPSQDSGNGNKSVQTTPPYSSPLYSPSQPSTLASSASQASSNSRWSRFIRKRQNRGWSECNSIEEEADYDEDKELTRPCWCFIGILGFLLLFFVFCLIIWVASVPYKPLIAVKSLTVSNFYISGGLDRTGVPTKLLTVNCSVEMIISNPSTFFGIHVSSFPVHLFYSKIAVATGQLKKYYQPKKSRQIVSMNVEGKQVPLYGAGAAFNNGGGVPWRLEFDVKSIVNVVGKLVRMKYLRHVSCSLAINSGSGLKLQEDSCTYD